MKSLFHVYCKALEALLVLALAVMVLLVFGNVVLRYAFNSGITVSEEVSRWLFIGQVAASAGFRYTGRRPEDEIDQLPSGRHVGDVHTAVLRAGEDRTPQSWDLEQSDSVRRGAKFLQ